MLKPVTFMKLKPTDQMRTIVATLLEDEFPYMLSLVTFSTVIFLSRTWLPGKKTIVVLEVKYISDSCAYSDSVVQLAEL